MSKCHTVDALVIYLYLSWTHKCVDPPPPPETHTLLLQALAVNKDKCLGDITASASDINPPSLPYCWSLRARVWSWLGSSESPTHWCQCKASHCYRSSELDSGEFGGDALLKRWNMTCSLRLVPPPHNKALYSLNSAALNMTNDKGTPRAALW